MKRATSRARRRSGCAPSAPRPGRAVRSTCRPWPTPSRRRCPRFRAWPMRSCERRPTMRPDASALRFGRRTVGDGAPLFVVAEIRVNHRGSGDRALALVDAAADAGADAIKLQTIVADELVAPSCPAPVHVNADSLADFFSTFELNELAHEQIAARAWARGLVVLATPFS